MVKQEVIKEGGVVEKLVAMIDLRKFYNDMHDNLASLGFTDIINDPEGGFLNNQANAGEMVDNKGNLNRTGDMYEKKFFYVKGDGVDDLEIVWKLRRPAPHSSYGYFEFEFNLVCRNIKQVEEINGSSKKVFQKGGWEFRNGLKYFNSYEDDYLNKIPIVKDSEIFKNWFFGYLHSNYYDDDVEFGHMLLKKIYAPIYKHFKTAKF
jgi:hypothetical protein